MPADPAWVRTSIPASRAFRTSPGVVHVGVDPDPVPVRGVGDRPVVLAGEPDPGLDDVHARFREPLDRRRGFLRRADADLVVLGPETHPAGDPGAGHQQAGAGDLAAGDAVAHREAGLERGPEVHRGGHPGEQELLRRDFHDVLDVHSLLVDPGEPAAVLAVAEDREVGVEVHHSRDHHPPAGVHHLGVRRNLQLRGAAHGDDAVALDQHRGVVQRGHVVAVEQHAADQRQPVLRRSGGREQQRGDQVEAGPDRGGHAPSAASSRW